MTATIIRLAKYVAQKKLDVADHPILSCPRCGGPAYPDYKDVRPLTVAYICSHSGKPHPGGDRSRTFRVAFDVEGRPRVWYSGWTGKRVLKVEPAMESQDASIF